jgi:hypothetical protein
VEEMSGWCGSAGGAPIHHRPRRTRLRRAQPLPGRRGGSDGVRCIGSGPSAPRVLGRVCSRSLVEGDAGGPPAPPPPATLLPHPPATHRRRALSCNATSTHPPSQSLPQSLASPCIFPCTEPQSSGTQTSPIALPLRYLSLTNYQRYTHCFPANLPPPRGGGGAGKGAGREPPPGSPPLQRAVKFATS